MAIQSATNSPRLNIDSLLQSQPSTSSSQSAGGRPNVEVTPWYQQDSFAPAENRGIGSGATLRVPDRAKGDIGGYRNGDPETCDPRRTSC